MPHYSVTALETFIVKTTYTVEADTPEAAEQLCKERKVAYENASIEEGDEVWIETVSIEED